ncbi:hypothetical protein PTTG_27915 [Puccinia triticina 1-1 BBBD Race 1]|uniref:Uncharacterized protein n=1 Tax=Puccinia triticina (isolate 1-1 / race 1 (BBBD)) TaxID=630390 RepID=A0A180GH91_PUCT1|nr:hypothetical protein PTTG_27915 [Puccinia triticina 1-1 BBBD Race 1]
MRFTITSAGLKWESFLLLSLLAASINSAPTKPVAATTQGMYSSAGICNSPCRSH